MGFFCPRNRGRYNLNSSIVLEEARCENLNQFPYLLRIRLVDTLIVFDPELLLEQGFDLSVFAANFRHGKMDP